MNAQDSPQPEYTMGYKEDFRQLLNRRSAATHASHLLPQLRSGLRVLDFGCGPATITIGLADAVDPGPVHGIDLEPTQVEMARAAAQAGGHDNITFHVGDAADLPFEDGYFDVAHCHAVLMHVPDVQSVLAEVNRVLKPGGLVACREVVVASSFLEPGSEEIDRAWETFTRLLSANGGHPQLGKELKRQLLDAGFEEVRPSFSFDSFGVAADVQFFYKFIVDWFFSPAVVDAATAHGLLTHEQFDEGRRALDAWSRNPGAAGAIGFGECLARKPTA